MSTHQVQVQADVDERDLGRVVKGTYFFVGVLGVSLVLSLGALLTFPMGIAGFLVCLLTIVSTALFGWANLKSARAIAAREDAHFSYFVAGMNMLAAFPFGALLSMYSWNVLARRSVQELYGSPFRDRTLPQDKKKPERKIVEPAAASPHVNLGNLDELEESMWLEMEKEHKARKSAEVSEKIKLKPADE